MTISTTLPNHFKGYFFTFNIAVGLLHNSYRFQKGTKLHETLADLTTTILKCETHATQYN